MLTKSTHLKGFAIIAKDGLPGTLDGELGRVDHLYFDDETWAVRYFVVDTGGWLAGRRVLISPISVSHTDWQAKELHVALTREQIEHSPDIDTHRPVSRQHEAELMGYYGYSYYWGGPNLWGPAFYPVQLSVPAVAPIGADAARTRIDSGSEASVQEQMDSHLRSTEAVTGYSIEATDGAIGHVEGFLVDDAVWAIRYIEVATRNWLPGKKVLVAPAWIERISWGASEVIVALTKEAIRTAPEYHESSPVSRDYEDLLYRHYGRPAYWARQVESAPSLSAGRI